MPAESLSVRTLVKRADVAQASIHYHFGDLERLYAEASAAALRDAHGWMTERLGELSVLQDSKIAPALQISLIASTIVDWTEGQRRLAMAARLCPSAEWHTAWGAFWSQCAAIIGLGEHSAVLANFALGESARHLLTWNAALDAALLEETVGALVLWLRQRRVATDTIRNTHQRIALTRYGHPMPPNDVFADAIGAAASELLCEEGHSGVTFRAVAARARVTFGKVVHVYGTKSRLLHGALHRLYEREALGGDLDWLLAQKIAPETMLTQLIDAVLDDNQPVLRAYDEIERAIYNGSEYLALRGVMRAMDDPSGTWALEQLRGGAQVSGSLVAAFSSTIRGVGFMVSDAGLSQAMLQTTAREALTSFR